MRLEDIAPHPAPWASLALSAAGIVSFGEGTSSIMPPPTGEFVPDQKYPLPQIAFHARPRRSGESREELVPLSLAARVERVNQARTPDEAVSLDYARGFLDYALYLGLVRNTPKQYMAVAHVESTRREVVELAKALFPEGRDIVTIEGRTHRHSPMHKYAITSLADITAVTESLCPLGELPELILQQRPVRIVADFVQEKHAIGVNSTETAELYEQLKPKLVEAKSAEYTEAFLPSPDYLAGLFDAGMGGIDLTTSKLKNTPQIRFKVDSRFSGMHAQLQQEYGGNVYTYEEHGFSAYTVSQDASKKLLTTLKEHVHLRKDLAAIGLEYLDEKEQWRLHQGGVDIARIEDYMRRLAPLHPGK